MLLPKLPQKMVNFITVELHMRYLVFGFLSETFYRKLNLHPNLTVKNTRIVKLVPDVIPRVNVTGDDVTLNILLPNATKQTMSDCGPIGNLVRLSNIKSFVLEHFSFVKDDSSFRLRFSANVEKK